MSNNNTSLSKKISGSAIAAAFLAATTQIGPGFTTQTTLFTSQYLGGFLLVIFGVLLLDLSAQGNVYRITCFTGRRAQEAADLLKPGLGPIFATIVVFSIMIFEFSNVSGTSLGVQALLGTSSEVSIAIAGLISILFFVSKSANKIIDTCVKIFGAILLISAAIIAIVSKPPVGEIFTQIVECDKTTLILPMATILGASAGGQASMIAPHRMIDKGITGPEYYGQYKKAQFTAAGIAYTVRILLFLCTFGVCMAGATIDPNNPAPSAFMAAAGTVGYKLFGVTMFCAGVTTVVGAAMILCTMIKNYIPFVEKYERQCCIGIIALCTFVDIFLGQPVTLMVAAGAINSLILPFVVIIMLLCSRSKRVMGENYTHPWFLTVGGLAVAVIGIYLGCTSFPALIELFV